MSQKESLSFPNHVVPFTYTFARNRQWHLPFHLRRPHQGEDEEKRRKREEKGKYLIWPTFTFKDGGHIAVGQIYAWTEQEIRELYQEGVTADILSNYGEVPISQMSAPFVVPHFTREHPFYKEFIWRCFRLLGRINDLSPSQEKQDWKSLQDRTPLETYEEMPFFDIDLGKTTYDPTLAQEYTRIYQQTMIKFGAQKEHTRVLVFRSDDIDGRSDQDIVPRGLHGYFIDARSFVEERHWIRANVIPVFEKRWRIPPGGVPWSKALDCPISLRLPYVAKMSRCKACAPPKSVEYEKKKSREQELKRLALSNVEAVQEKVIMNLMSSDTTLNLDSSDISKRRIVHHVDDPAAAAASVETKQYSRKRGTKGGGSFYQRAVGCPECCGTMHIYEDRRYIPAFIMNPDGMLDEAPLAIFREFDPPRKGRNEKSVLPIATPRHLFPAAALATPPPPPTAVATGQSQMNAVMNDPKWRDLITKLLITCDIRMPRSNQHTRFILPKESEYVRPLLPKKWKEFALELVNMEHFYRTTPGGLGPVGYIHSKHEFEVNMIDSTTQQDQKSNAPDRRKLAQSKAIRELRRQYESMMIQNSTTENDELDRRLTDLLRQPEFKKPYIPDWKTDSELRTIHYQQVEVLEKYINRQLIPEYAQLTVRDHRMNDSGAVYIWVSGPGDNACMIAGTNRRRLTPHPHKSEFHKIYFVLRRFLSDYTDMMRLYQQCNDPECVNSSYSYDVRDMDVQCFFNPKAMITRHAKKLSPEQKQICQLLMSKTLPISKEIDSKGNSQMPNKKSGYVWWNQASARVFCRRTGGPLTEEQTQALLPKPPDYQPQNNWISYMECFPRRSKTIRYFLPIVPFLTMSPWHKQPPRISERNMIASLIFPPPPPAHTTDHDQQEEEE